MSTQTKEGGKQSHGKKNNIVRFKLSLGTGMNSEDEVSCTHFTIWEDIL